MEALKRQRGVIKGSMTKLQAYAKSNIEKANIDEIYVKITRTQQLMTEFMNTERLMFTEDAKAESDLSDFEDNYYTVLSALNGIIRKRSLSAPSQSTQANNTILNTTQLHSAEVRLPKISIPKFDGNYLEWQSFFDIYTSTIHDKENLTAAQKFQYLKSSIYGEPAALIRHFPVTDANYHEAFTKLIQRYDRKHYTINSFIRSFMEQPSISQPTSSNIRKIADAFDEVIRGLKALGKNAENRDHWLTYIALTKVDSETRALWAQQPVGEELPTFEDLLKFLHKRTDALETEKGFSQKIQPTRTTKLRTLTTTTFPACSICKEGEHLIHQCSKFKNMTTEQRSILIKSMFRCFNCFSKNHRVSECKSKGRCQTCHRKHHSMLHLSVLDQSSQEPNKSVTIEAERPNYPNSSTTACANTSVTSKTAVLPTAIVNIRDRHGEFHPFKALLDSASQSSFISESCVQKLGSRRYHGRVLIKGIGDTTIGQTRGKMELCIAPTSNPKMVWKTEAFIVSKIAVKLNQHDAAYDDEMILNDIQLADPTFNEPGNIDVLLGVDIFAKAMQGQTRELSSGLIAMKTVFGWVVSGTSSNTNQPETANFNISIDIDRSLKQFWEIEEVQPTYKKLTDEEEACEEMYKATTNIGEDNKFNVRLPFRGSHNTLGSSFHVAMSRLQSVERKFRTNKDFKEMYTEFMKEYIQLGHMTRINDAVLTESYYLPHHGVLRETSSTTKLRVVFDGSAKSTTSVSLNDVLMVGPTIQDTLFQILIRFRQHKFALIGDIEKMYRQVWVDPNDRHHQNILWREDSNLPVQTYQLNTVTYGTASAPFLAIRSLKEVGIRNLQTSPAAARIIMRDFYVDDLMSGATTNEELLKLTKDIKKLLSNHGFNLRKVQSNSNVLQSDQGNTKALTEKSIDSYSPSIKVLGISWEPTRDVFKFRCQLNECQVFTKRSLLSEAGKIFDPLGWISPLTIRVKILFQDLWLQELSWDDKLPVPTLQTWAAIREDFQKIDTIVVPRWLGTTKKVSIHGFSDASEKAYAAVVYAVTQDEDDTQNEPILIAAKTKVAPLKQQSLPRLELMGALLLSKLVNTIETSFELTLDRKVLWTDSEIVLDWLSAQPRRWATFIANRTSEILDSHPKRVWKHVPSKDNPADIASRGTAVCELVQNKLWWNGPQWLTKESDWPTQSKKNDAYEITTEEMRPTVKSMHTTLEKTWYDEFIERYSSYHKTIKILAMIQRYVANLKTRLKRHGNITRCEILKAEQTILKYVQLKDFPEDIKRISKGKPLLSSSKLKCLSPFLDDNGLLRVGGRIEMSIATFSVKHPIILSNQGNLTKTIACELHETYHHAGIGALINIIRRKFWILKMRQLAKSTVHKCIKCFRHNPTTESQIMGNLPEARVVYSHPFKNVGVDYCGPFKVHTIRRRGLMPSKAYVCIFICLSTRAVHIEVAMSLTTDSFMGALKRFISRRGLCSTIYSDNGTNFIGARNELVELYKFIKQNSNEISSFLLKSNIEWRFNPPAAPHMGGIWEAAVKVAKICLKKTLGETIPTLEEFSTLMTQIESMMNSRPIAVNSSADIDALTPGHFLIGRPLIDIPDVDITNQKLTPTARWHVIKQLQQHFWKRWHREYLTTLQTRQKWQHQRNNVSIGDIVLVVDDNLPPTRWALGKIINTHPGHDGKVRVVTLKLGHTGNLTKRPIHKICKLPHQNTSSVESADSRGPECLKISEAD